MAAVAALTGDCCSQAAGLLLRLLLRLLLLGCGCYIHADRIMQQQPQHSGTRPIHGVGVQLMCAQEGWKEQGG